MDCSTPSFLHYLLKFAHTLVHWVNDAIQPFHPLSSPFPPALSLPQHQDLFQWVSSSHHVAKFSFSISPSMNIQGWFPCRLTSLISLMSKELSKVFSSTRVWKHQLFASQPSYGPAHIHIYDYWKNHSFDYMDLVGKVMSLLFNTLSRFVIAFLPRGKHLLILWLQSPFFPMYLPWSNETGGHGLSFLNDES